MSSKRAAARGKHLKLADVDLSQKFDSKAAYESRKRDLQLTMLKIQQAYLIQGRRAVVLFEGWDAAGKGGAIRTLTGKLDPRGVKVWPISRPSEREKSVHYLYRFWQRLPERGTIAVFDRSWYGRVLVERLEELAEPAEWRRAYDEINDFERLLTDDGVPVIKLFLHVSPEVQIERLRERMETPYKRWKLTIEDLQNRDNAKAYERAVDDMLKHTSTKHAPWHVLASDHKWFSRIESLRIVSRGLSRGVDLSPPPVPEAFVRYFAALQGL